MGAERDRFDQPAGVEVFEFGQSPATFERFPYVDGFVAAEPVPKGSSTLSYLDAAAAHGSDAIVWACTFDTSTGEARFNHDIQQSTFVGQHGALAGFWIEEPFRWNALARRHKGPKPKEMNTVDYYDVGLSVERCVAFYKLCKSVRKDLPVYLGLDKLVLDCRETPALKPDGNMISLGHTRDLVRNACDVLVLNFHGLSLGRTLPQTLTMMDRIAAAYRPMLRPDQRIAWSVEMSNHLDRSAYAITADDIEAICGHLKSEQDCRQFFFFSLHPQPGFAWDNRTKEVQARVGAIVRGLRERTALDDLQLQNSILVGRLATYQSIMRRWMVDFEERGKAMARDARAMVDHIDKGATMLTDPPTPTD